MSNKLNDLIGWFSEGDYDRVIEMMNKMGGAVNRSPELLLMQSEIYIKTGNTKKAAEILVENNETILKSKDVAIAAAELLEELGQSIYAVKLLLKIYEPGDKKIYRTIVRIKRKIGKRKITLITNTYSGCNSRALYDNTPDEIKRKYEIRLVKERPIGDYDSFVSDSDFVITTHGNYHFNDKQINLDLWHGFPLKAMAYMDPGDNRKSESIHRVWDNVNFISSYSTLFNTVLNSCIGQDIKKYKIFGAPRNDYFQYRNIIDFTKVLGFDISKKKTILYCPTFRTTVFNPSRNEGERSYNNIFGINEFNDDVFLDFLESNDLYFIIKLHPVEQNIYKNKLGEKNNSRVVFLTEEILEEYSFDLYNIVTETDLLITDYSSIFFDFLLTEKPILFCNDDIDKYKLTRGFLLEPYEFWTPGPKVTDQDAIQWEIIKLLEDQNYYSEERKQIRDLVHQYKDFNSSQRIWRFIDDMLDVDISSIIPSGNDKYGFFTIEQYKQELTDLVESGKLSKALDLIRDLDGEFQDDNDLMCIYSTIYFLNGQLDSAISYLEKSYLANREHVDTLFNLGLLHFEDKSLDASRFFYTKALEVATSSDDSVSCIEIKDKLQQIGESTKSSREKVLVASPIYRNPNILSQFLSSLLDLKSTGIDVHYYFVDDNVHPESMKILREFKQNNKNVLIMKSHNTTPYHTNHQTHIWKEELIWKVGEYKNDMLDYAKINNFDYIFLVDSDLVLHPNTLIQLHSQKKDIVSNIFWTKWTPDSIDLPQVWLSDSYTLFNYKRGEAISEEEKQKRTAEFVNQLRTPGIYEVGGLGACTLISKEAIDKGVSFREIPNLSFAGEDRHFCIRAAALGLKLFVDTHYPALHIYRDSDISLVHDFKIRNKLSV